MMQIIRFIVVAGAVLASASAVNSLIKMKPERRISKDVGLLAAAGNTYLGPKSPLQGNPQLVQVQVILKDSGDSAGPQLTQVEFVNQSIPLKPRGVDGGRGSASFQLRPGKYHLRWTVNLQKQEWPRQVTREEEVIINPRDLWIQLEITGDQVTIS